MKLRGASQEGLICPRQDDYVIKTPARAPEIIDFNAVQGMLRAGRTQPAVGQPEDCQEINRPARAHMNKPARRANS